MKNVDCLIAVALSEEFKPLFSILQMSPEPDAPGYYSFEFRDRDRNRRRGAAFFIGDMGTEAAVLHTEKALRRYNADVIVNLGVSGTLSSDCKLGDVVVGSDIDNYLKASKVTGRKKGGIPELGGESFPTDKGILSQLKHLPYEHEAKYRSWQTLGKQTLSRFNADDFVARLIGENCLRSVPELVPGPIASGPIVIASEAWRARLRERNRKYLAVDMESVGVMMSSLSQEENAPRTLILRGISDNADENKSDLDSQTQGAIRSLATQNAIGMLRVAIEEVIEFQTPVATGGKASADRSQLIDQVRNNSRQALDPWLAKESTRVDTNTSEQVLRWIVHADPVLHPDRPILSALTDLVEASDSNRPLRVFGNPGTGKSSLLALLYLEWDKAHVDDPSRPVPVYIDLHSYDRRVYADGGGHAGQALDECDRDLAPLRDLIESYPETELWILLDGNNQYDKYQSAVRDRVRSILSNIHAKKIVSIGLAPGDDDFLHCQDLDIEDAERQIHLRGMDPASPDVDKFVRAVARSRSSSNERLVMQRLQRMRLRSVDLLLVSLLFEVQTTSRQQPVETFGDLIKAYCERSLAHYRTEYVATEPPGADRTFTLRDASALAYRYTILKKDFAGDELSWSPYWELIHRHPVIADFLVAYHIIMQLRDLGADDSAGYGRIEFVYPHRINRFCKDIMNFSRDTQVLVMKAIQEGYDQADVPCKPHLCYLAGRVEDVTQQEEAREFLQQVNKALVPGDDANLGEFDFEELLLLRTVAISLVVLGDKGESDRYIQRLLRHPSWEDLNRGFHLEYYGDIPYDPTVRLTRRDYMADCKQTFQLLRKRIDERHGDPDYTMLDIDLFTLISLAQHRHADGHLDERFRVEAIDIIDRMIRVRKVVRSNELKHYAEMVQKHLSSEEFRVGSLLLDLYGLKSTRREGWVARNLVNSESVADHMYAGHLMARVFLPEAIEDPEYDKHRIIDIVLIHDVLEAYIGDHVRKDDAVREEEGRRSLYLRMFETYKGVYGLSKMHELWEEYEAKTTINAKVAHDIDRLENLVQLYVYQIEGRQVEGFDAWERDLHDAIKTSPGIQLKDTIVSAMAHRCRSDEVSSGSESALREQKRVSPDLGALPHVGPRLFGREAETQQLNNAWRGNVGVVGLIGEAGNGKTSLVNHWARERGFAKTVRVCAWSTYYQHREGKVTSSDDLIARALQAIGRAEPAMDDVQEPVQLLVEALRRNRTLLIIDGLEKLQEAPGGKNEVGVVTDSALRRLLFHFVTSGNGLCVVTSRLPLTELQGHSERGYLEIQVGPLPEVAATELVWSEMWSGENPRRPDSHEKTLLLEWARFYAGRPLSLSLLGGLARTAYQNNLSKIKKAPNLLNDSGRGSHAARILQDYERVLANSAELDIMRIVGLCDQAVPEDVIREFASEPKISGLNENLIGLDDAGMNICLASLVERHLLWITGESPRTVSCHPLVREFFAQSLIDVPDPELATARIQGHQRLCEYYSNSVAVQPTNEREMESLYRAVEHGVAGMQTRSAFEDIYERRIRRHRSAFNTDVLGQFGKDYETLMGFIGKDGDVLEAVKDRTEFIVGQIGLDLRAKGDLESAIKWVQKALDADLAVADHANASRSADILSHTYLLRGSLDMSVAYAEKALESAAKVESERVSCYLSVISRANLANALHHQGKSDEALEHFERAERENAVVDRDHPRLRSVQGFRYCELLCHLGRYEEAIERARDALDRDRCEGLVPPSEARFRNKLQTEGAVLPAALDHLTLATIHLARVEMNPMGADLETARSHVERAVRDLGRSGHRHEIPRGQLVLAKLRRLEDNHGEAKRILNSLVLDCDALGMRIYEVESRLGLLCLCLTEGDRLNAQDHFDRALRLIQSSGYEKGRRQLDELASQLNLRLM